MSQDDLSKNNDSAFQVFDPAADVLKIDRCLPHWAQARTLCFLTWRTDDSIPKPVLDRWLKERWEWLRAHDIDPLNDNWKLEVERLARAVRNEFTNEFSDRWHEMLDQCHGECVLQQRALSEIVENSFHHFDNDRYILTDFVIMPNHVHVLCAFRDEESMLAQCESWKHFTATQINRQLGRSGRFWQQDGFDHLIRTVDEFEFKRNYIADNPRKAGLSTQISIHFSKPL